MSASVHGDVRIWGGSRDDEGFREFTVTHLVKTTSVADGPYIVMNASGLPAIGSVWSFGNDLDVWAFCYPYMKVDIHQPKEGDKNYWWRVDQKFSTKPLTRCQTQNVEDPLSEPQKVSGNFGKFTIEAVYDRFGNLIKSSSHEQIRGRQVEFDNNKPSVVIQQNVAALGLSTFAQMIDTVNDGPMWGLPARCVKLSNAPWERKYYGACYVYYTRTFEFDIDYNTFDRTALDEGTKVLRGHWDRDTGSPTYREWIVDAGVSVTKPTHFDRYKDWNGENTRAILNGAGVPITSAASAGEIDVEYYQQSNFFTLGIPVVF